MTPAQDAIDAPTVEGGCRFRPLCPIGRDKEVCRTVDPAPGEHDILVHALNERSMELGMARRWAYSGDEQ